MYQGRKATQKDIIYYMIWAHGPVTCEEVEKLTGFKHQTVSARIAELHVLQPSVASKRVAVAGQSLTVSGKPARTYVAK